MTKNLFQPLRLGDLALPSRVVMAPMTRSRADDEGVQPEIAEIYYGQRAGAGMIISEGIYPSAMGKGYVRTPGLHTDAQVAAWSKVTKAVHDNGGRIIAQIMHTGRVAVPAFLPGGALPVAPSAIRAEGQAYTDQGMVPMVTPRALETSEIAGVIAEYRNATRRALEAGFDGVELHAASGYLPEQFLSSKSNQRTDAYGGSVANRVRFVVEVLEAMASVAGSGRVGLKISPEMNFNDVSDDTPQETYRHLVERIASLNLAYLHVALFGTPTNYHGLLRPLFRGAYLAGGGFTGGSAEAALAQGRADAIVFGAAFIANPDLPKRLAEGLSLAEPDKATFYAPGPQGYIDYPAAV
jgi:N-ethylmaleimide reductase